MVVTFVEFQSGVNKIVLCSSRVIECSRSTALLFTIEYSSCNQLMKSAELLPYPVSCYEHGYEIKVLTITMSIFLD